MSKLKEKAIGAALAVFVVAGALLLVFIFVTLQQEYADCADRGGEMIRTPTGNVCAKVTRI